MIKQLSQIVAAPDRLVMGPLVTRTTAVGTTRPSLPLTVAVPERNSGQRAESDHRSPRDVQHLVREDGIVIGKEDTNPQSIANLNLEVDLSQSSPRRQHDAQFPWLGTVDAESRHVEGNASLAGSLLDGSDDPLERCEGGATGPPFTPGRARHIQHDGQSHGDSADGPEPPHR